MWEWKESCQQKYYLLKKSAQQSRIIFLHELAAHHAARGNEKISYIIHWMNRNEELRNSYRRIINATKPVHGAIDKVLTNIWNNENQEEATNEKEIIEKALCVENIKNL